MLKKISFGFLAHGFSIFIEALTTIVSIPLLLKYYSDSITGIWLFFLAFNGLILLGQCGLAPITARYVAKIKVSKSDDDAKIFWSTFSYLYKAATFFVFLICLIIYWVFIHSTLSSESFIQQGSICWVLLSISYCIRVYFIKYLHILNGLGEVGWDKVSQILLSLTNIIGLYAVLINGLNFYYLGAVYLISSLLSSILIVTVFGFLNKTISIVKTQIDRKFIYKIIRQCSKILFLNTASYIILQSSVILITHFLSPSSVPYYSALLKITFFIMALGGIVTQLLYPFISQAFHNGNTSKVKKLFYANIGLTNAIVLVCGITVFLLGDWILELWLGKDAYLGRMIFGSILLHMFIYVNGTAFTNSVIATGGNYFTLPTLCSVLLTIPLSIFGIVHFGLIGLVVGNLIGITPTFYSIIWSILYISKIDKSSIER